MEAKEETASTSTVDKVRGYDCTHCKIHFEAETEYGDAHEFDPDCPKCGDPTGFNCLPCGGDSRNGDPFPALVGSPLQVVVSGTCLFPSNIHHEVVSRKT